MSSLALLLPKDFAVFERQFLLEYFTERTNYFNLHFNFTYSPYDVTPYLGGGSCLYCKTGIVAAIMFWGSLNQPVQVTIYSQERRGATGNNFHSLVLRIALLLQLYLDLSD